MKTKRMFTLLMVLLMLISTIAVGCTKEETTTPAADTTDTTATTDDTATDTPAELDKLTLQLKWLPQSQFMGYYVADAMGFYEEEGIDIEILSGGADIIPEQQVYNGVADVGVTWVSSLLKYQSQGWELVEVAQMFQKSAMLLVSKAATGIETAEDLAGKKIGSWFGGNEYEIYALLEATGLDRDTDVELVQQDYTMNQVINDEIDAASAMIYNEYGLLLESGIDAADLNVLDMNDAGVAMMEDCLFVSAEWIAENEDLYVRFLRASIKGWAAACADPAAAGQTVFEVDESVSLDHQIYMAEEIAKLVVPEGFDPANIGYIDMDAIQQTADMAFKYGLLDEAADLSEATVTSKYFEMAIE